MEDAILVERGKNQQTAASIIAAVMLSGGAPAGLNSDGDPVDLAMLKQSLGEDGAREILQSFVSFVSEVMVELQEAIRSRRASNAATALAELSKSCTVIGACSLLSVCIGMEQELSRSQWEEVEISMTALVRETRVLGQFVCELLS